MILTIPGENPVLIEDDQDYATRRDIQILLRRYHKKEPRPQCGCTYNGKPLKLVIRLWYTGRYFLASSKNEGENHDKDCRFYSVNLGTSLSNIYTTNAIKEMADGTLSVKLEGGLKSSSKDVLNMSGSVLPKRDIEGNGPRRKRSTVSPLGILHLLWVKSRLNRWYPQKWVSRRGKKSYEEVWRGVEILIGAARNIRCDDISIASRLIVYFPNATTKNSEVFDSVIDSVLPGDVNKDDKLVVIGAIKSVTKDREYSWTIRWDGYCKNDFYLTGHPDLIQDILIECPGAERRLDAPLDDRVDRVIGIFIATGLRRARSKETGNPYISAKIQRGGIMIVSREMIPVDSSYELVVANSLINERRDFEKPLLFDGKIDDQLPDFILHDVGDKSFPMEVFDRSDDKYKAHRKKKVERYKKEYGTNWWEWDLTEDNRAVMPPIPPAVRPPDGRK